MEIFMANTALHPQAFDQLPDSAICRPDYACRILGISRATLLRIAQRGQLTKVRVGLRCTGFKVGQIRALLSQQKEEA